MNKVFLTDVENANFNCDGEDPNRNKKLIALRFSANMPCSKIFETS